MVNYNCPHCNKTPKGADGLRKHIARMHSEQAGQPATPPPAAAPPPPAAPPAGDPPAAPASVLDQAATHTETPPAGESLKIKPPASRQAADPPAAPAAEAAPYHCADCGGTVTKGQAECPACGAELAWGAVK